MSGAGTSRQNKLSCEFFFETGKKSAKKFAGGTNWISAIYKAISASASACTAGEKISWHSHVSFRSWRVQVWPLWP